MGPQAMCWKSTMGATRASYGSGSVRVQRIVIRVRTVPLSPDQLWRCWGMGITPGGCGIMLVLWVWCLVEPDSLHAEHSLLQSDNRHCTRWSRDLDSQSGTELWEQLRSRDDGESDRQWPIAAMCSRTGVGMRAGRTNPVAADDGWGQGRDGQLHEGQRCRSRRSRRRS